MARAAPPDCAPAAQRCKSEPDNRADKAWNGIGATDRWELQINLRASHCVGHRDEDIGDGSAVRMSVASVYSISI